mmetsp:Transcript_8789/g.29294  ORF Transcript_8789/g.29294 Transcript_8789/m.29294 type:complete len:566 (+) Transcript_8789:700-2397(+)
MSSHSNAKCFFVCFALSSVSSLSNSKSSDFAIALATKKPAFCSNLKKLSEVLKQAASAVACAAADADAATSPPPCIDLEAAVALVSAARARFSVTILAAAAPTATALAAASVAPRHASTTIAAPTEIPFRSSLVATGNAFARFVHTPVARVVADDAARVISKKIASATRFSAAAAEASELADAIAIADDAREVVAGCVCKAPPAFLFPSIGCWFSVSLKPSSAASRSAPPAGGANTHDTRRAAAAYHRAMFRIAIVSVSTSPLLLFLLGDPDGDEPVIDTSGIDGLKRLCAAQRPRRQTISSASYRARRDANSASTAFAISTAPFVSSQSVSASRRACSFVSANTTRYAKSGNARSGFRTTHSLSDSSSESTSSSASTEFVSSSEIPPLIFDGSEGDLCSFSDFCERSTVAKASVMSPNLDATETLAARRCARRVALAKFFAGVVGAERTTPRLIPPSCSSPPMLWVRLLVVNTGGLRVEAPLMCRVGEDGPPLLLFKRTEFSLTRRNETSGASGGSPPSAASIAWPIRCSTTRCVSAADTKGTTAFGNTQRARASSTTVSFPAF